MSSAVGDSTNTQVRHKRHLRNYLLDKRLQLRYVLVVTAVSAIIAGVLGYLLWYQETYASRTIMQGVAGADFIDAEMKAWISGELDNQDRGQMVTMLIIGIGLMAVLSGYLVIMTHQVAGPLFKISLYFDRMRDGKLPKVYALRKGDQLRDFFDKFAAMDEALRHRTEQEIALYEKFLAEAGAAGVTAQGALGHQLDELRAAIKSKQASLE